MKNNKGITLIALVITIVVMLILAAVTISLVLGENGVVTTAEETRIDGRFSTIADEVYDREATIPTAIALGTTAETATSFIDRMKIRGLVADTDEYNEETRMLYIGKRNDGTFKYKIYLADELEETRLVDNTTGELPDADLDEKLKNMTLITETTEANQEVIFPISNTTGLTINWDAANNPDNFIEEVNHQYAQPGVYEIQIKGIAEDNTIFGSSNRRSNVLFILHRTTI